MTAPRPRPYVETIEPARPVTAAVLVLHGGKSSSLLAPRDSSLSMLRMRPFFSDVGKVAAEHGIATDFVHYRRAGWNGPEADAAADARWALVGLRERYGDVPVVLLGHSMGGRAAMRCAAERNVVGVVGLAPWLPPEEPVPDLAGRTVLIAHGLRDRWVDPRFSLRWAQRAKARYSSVARFEIAWSGHGMLRRAGVWAAFARHGVLGLHGVEPLWPVVANALHEESPAGVQVPLVVPRPTSRIDG